MRSNFHMSISYRSFRRSLVFLLFLLAGAWLPATASEGSFQRTLPVTGPVNLDLNTGSGSVNVRTGTSSEVQVTGHIKVTNWFGGDADERVKRIEANPPIQQNGNDIRIGHIEDTQLLRNISISYDLVVPAETQLHSHTGSGNQSVEGIRRQVEIESGSGSLKISDIGDTVRAETGSGEIAIDRVKGNVRTKAGSGSIHAQEIAGSDSRAILAAGILRWSKRRRVRYALIRVRAEWNCEVCMVRSRLKQAAALSPPKEIRRVHGRYTRDPAPYA